MKLKSKFPKLKSFWSLIKEYEKRDNKESQFVYVIEKLEPILVVLLTEKDHWIKRKITLDNFIDRKQKKIKSIDSFAQNFTFEILEYIRKNKKKYFKEKY